MLFDYAMKEEEVLAMKERSVKECSCKTVESSIVHPALALLPLRRSACLDWVAAERGADVSFTLPFTSTYRSLGACALIAQGMVPRILFLDIGPVRYSRLVDTLPFPPPRSAGRT